MTSATDLLAGTYAPTAQTAPTPDTLPTPQEVQGVQPLTAVAGPGFLNAVRQGDVPLWHASRQGQWAQDVGPGGQGSKVPEDVLWGTTHPDTPGYLSVSGDSAKGWDDLTRTVLDRGPQSTVDPAHQQAAAILQATGSKLVSEVGSHGLAQRVYQHPGQAPLASAAFELSRFNVADKQGLLQGSTFEKAADTWHDLKSGGSVSPQRTQQFQDALSSFASGMAWVEHPELALDPHLTISGINGDGGKTTVTLKPHQFPETTWEKLQPEDLQNRVNQLFQNPTAMVDPMRANIEEFYKQHATGTIGNGKSIPAAVNSVALGMKNVSIPTSGSEALNQAYKIVAAQIGNGTTADQVKQTVSAHYQDAQEVPGMSGMLNSRISALLLKPGASPDWSKLVSPLPLATVDSLNSKPNSSSDSPAVQMLPDGTFQVNPGPDPNSTRGLQPTPLTLADSTVLTPSTPYSVIHTQKEAQNLNGTWGPWNLAEQWPTARSGHWLTVSPLQQTVTANGSVSTTAERQTGQFLAELSQRGLQPQSETGHPVTQGNNVRVPSFLNFDSASDRNNAIAVLPDNSTPVVHVNGASEAPPGWQQAWETHFTDSSGANGIVMSQTQGDSPVFVPQATFDSLPDVLKNEGRDQHPFDQVDGKTVLDGQVVVAGGQPSTGSGFWGAKTDDGKVPSQAILSVPPVGVATVAYGSVDPSLVGGDPSQTVIVNRLHTRGVEVLLPDQGGQVSADLAHRVLNVLRRTGVTQKVTFGSQAT